MEHIDKRPDLVRVDADLLIPGRGQPIKGASLIASRSKILHVGATDSLPHHFDALKAVKVPVLMPGMWDCHVHFLGADAYSLEALGKTLPALAGARVARDLAATLDAGFTSTRELAGYGIDVYPAVRSGWLRGPKIYSSASIISMTAGHDDLRSDLICINKDRAMRGSPMYVCDGIDECLKAVRMQVRRGAKVIKVATTGGVGSPDDLDSQQFSMPELKAIVGEAARNRLVVAAHCHGTPGVKAAILAGCKTVEHASFLDDECIRLMKEKEVIMVATRSIQDFGARHPEIWTPEQYEKIKLVDKASKKSYMAAIKAGVTIALGTDIAISSPSSSFRHGTNGREFALAVEAGMTPLEAIEAGTARSPETLGHQAPLSGQLKKGYDADFIALTVSPLENIRILGSPECVTHVWKDGVEMKASIHHARL